MDTAGEAERAMVAFLSHWLAEAEVRSWLRACATYAAGAADGAPADPWAVVRAALDDLLEAKTLVDLYRENAQEGPDPFSADLRALARILPPRAAGPGTPERTRLLLHTKEVLERCQGRPRRVPGNPEAGLNPVLGAAEGLPRRRRL